MTVVCPGGHLSGRLAIEASVHPPPDDALSSPQCGPPPLRDLQREADTSDALESRTAAAIAEARNTIVVRELISPPPGARRSVPALGNCVTRRRSRRLTIGIGPQPPANLLFAPTPRVGSRHIWLPVRSVGGAKRRAARMSGMGGGSKCDPHAMSKTIPTSPQSCGRVLACSAACRRCPVGHIPLSRGRHSISIACWRHRPGRVRLRRATPGAIRRRRCQAAVSSPEFRDI